MGTAAVATTDDRSGRRGLAAPRRAAAVEDAAGRAASRRTARDDVDVEAAAVDMDGIVRRRGSAGGCGGKQSNPGSVTVDAVRTLALQPCQPMTWSPLASWPNSLG